jgi:CRP-like cAMP-binding protein
VARPNFQNLLLQRVSDSDLALLASLTRVEVALHQHLYEAHAPLTAIYFPEDCLASIVAEVGRGTIEVGIVGREGVTNSWIVVGDTQSPFETFVQAAGHAYRVDAAEAKAAIEQSPALRQLFLTFARSYEIQVPSSSIASGQALLEERLARWLLMVGDRLGLSFAITHEFLAAMLAVRRSGVTLALQVLEGKGLIRSTRGNVAITDRDGLVARANGAYGLAEREYARLFGGGG